MTQRDYPLCTSLTRIQQKVAVIAKFKNILRAINTRSLSRSRASIGRQSQRPLSEFFSRGISHRSIIERFTFRDRKDAGYLVSANTLPPITEVLIGVRDFSSCIYCIQRVCIQYICMCICACVYARLFP